MATCSSPTSSQHQSIEEMVTCPICMERMENPKHLNCQHAFCMLCIQDWSHEPGNSSHSISCPVCRKTTKMNSGVYHLPTDINVVRLIDVLNSSMGDPQSSVSSNVQMSGSSETCAHDNSPSVAFCDTCADNLCTKCVGIHKKEKAMAHHFIRNTLKKCRLHPKRSLDLFCNRCKKLVCSTCVHGPHSKHKIQSVTEVAKRSRKEIRKLSENLSDRVLAERRNSLNPNSQEAADVTMAEIESLIESQVKKGKKAIETWQAGMVDEVNRIKTNIRQETVMKEVHLDTCNSVLLYVANFQQPDTDLELLDSLTNIKDQIKKAEELLNSHEAPQDQLSHRDVAFVPEHITTSLGHLTTEAQGNLSMTSDASASNLYSPSSPAVSPTTLSPHTPTLYPDISDTITPQASAPDIRLARITPVPGLVGFGFNIMDDSWHNEDFSFFKRLHQEEQMSTSFGHAAVSFLQWVSGNKDEQTQPPVDVAIDNTRGYLYIIDRGWFTAGSVKRYAFPRDYRMTMSKVVMNELTAYGLAVSQTDGTIAASVSDVLYTHIRGVIPERRQTTDLISVDKLFPHTVRSPRGFSITDDNVWVVVDNAYCVVALYQLEDSNRFKHMISFGSRGSNVGQFESPSYVCCSSVRDQIIVSDSGNHRVQCFNMRGQFVWESGGKGTDPGDFISPHGVCMDGAGNILVANTGNKRIDVLSGRDGHFLKSVSTDVRALNYIAPFNVALYSPRDESEAYLVMSGVNGRMPVISMLKYYKDGPMSYSSYY